MNNEISGIETRCLVKRHIQNVYLISVNVIIFTAIIMIICLVCDMIGPFPSR